VDGGTRERLLGLVQARLERFNADHDPATILAPEATAELTALLELVPDPETDLEIAYAAGCLRWVRHQVLGSDGQQERAEALELLEPVYQAQPDEVPDEVRSYFDRQVAAFTRLAAPNDPQAIADEADRLLREALTTGSQADLDAVVDVSRQVTEATSADLPGRARFLSILGSALTVRFRWTGNRDDLNAAIDAGQLAVTASNGQADYAGHLSNLSSTLLVRFMETGEQADLDTAIDDRRRAAAQTPTGHPHYAAMMSGLGFALTKRFERTGSRADLDAAIDAGQQAVDATPVGAPSYMGSLTMLGAALQRRFEQTRDRADLDTAIDIGQQAVDATPTGHPDRPAMLSALGGALQRRFEQTGDQADLDTAIDTDREAVTASPADSPGRTGYLSNLGLALRIRYERSGHSTDLDAAIDACQQAVDTTPAGHPDRPAMLSALGLARQARFELNEDRADLDAAVSTDREAVKASPAGYPGLAGYLSNLGQALRVRFERFGNAADLDAAIDNGQQAVDASPDHPDHATMLSMLGLAQQKRFEQTGNIADLDAAIDNAQQAVDDSPTGYPGRSGHLSNLGLARQARFERTKNPADLDAAIDAGRKAVAVKGAAPRVRAIAARRWGNAAASGQRWREAMAGYAAAAELLGLVAPRSLARRDQEHLLEQFGGLAAEATAGCVQAGHIDRAVELFEQSRGVLLGQALDTRTSLTALTEQRPDLAARFTALRADLDRDDGPAGMVPPQPIGRAASPTDGHAEAARRAADREQAAAAFDHVIAEIRQLPEFDGFLRPPPIGELLTAAREPVVIVTVSRFSSYALILTSAGVLEPVPLAALTPETVYDQVTAFLGALNDAQTALPTATRQRQAAEERLGDTLAWLWDNLAGPVLDRLGITGPPPIGTPPPRLWWCVSGLLSFLPVHAAGQHAREDAVPATVIDRVICSYIPTIRALAYARRSSANTVGNPGGQDPAGNRVIAVAMPHTPGELDLPTARAEVVGLEHRFPGRVTVLMERQATREAVMTALRTGRWVHFACHADSDPSNPSASHLKLADQQKLTVADAARLRLDDASLAFLSACTTGRPDGRLADEAIHLASAFQLAGYRHVIATLWPINDLRAREIADQIYTTLAATGDDDVASAVHTATQQVRRRRRDYPSEWASHIHVGA
jgi:hypothetical protein